MFFMLTGLLEMDWMIVSMLRYLLKMLKAYVHMPTETVATLFKLIRGSLTSSIGDTCVYKSAYGIFLYIALCCSLSLSLISQPFYHSLFFYSLLACKLTLSTRFLDGTWRKRSAFANDFKEIHMDQLSCQKSCWGWLKMALLKDEPENRV